MMQQIPPIRLLATSGREVNLAQEAAQKHLVLFIYPGDGAGLRYPELAGCTAEACSIRDSISQFRQRGAAPFGISLQSTERQRAFAEREHLPFELLSDQAEELVQALQVPVWESPEGERFAARATFLIAKGGQILQRFDEIHVEHHVAEVLQALRSVAEVG